jgi:hypothetical protein
MAHPLLNQQTKEKEHKSVSHKKANRQVQLAQKT